MKIRLAFLAGTALGYLLGARAGRSRYEKIKDQATTAWQDPKVQEGLKSAGNAIKEQAPLVAEKAKETLANSTEKAKSAAGDFKEKRAESKAEKKAQKLVDEAPADVISDPQVDPSDEGPAPAA